MFFNTGKSLQRIVESMSDRMKVLRTLVTFFQETGRKIIFCTSKMSEHTFQAGSWIFVGDTENSINK